jgi:hypothetical protein
MAIHYDDCAWTNVSNLEKYFFVTNILIAALVYTYNW